MASALRTAYHHGHQAALRKFALAAPTLADAFGAEVEGGKDMPPPTAPGMDGMQAPPLPQEDGAPLGDPVGALPAEDAALNYADGMTSALKKFAVSGSMYARALQGAAQRRGGSFPSALAGEISAMPRPNPNPYWRQAAGEVARIPGALMPSPEKLRHQAYLDQMPWGATEGTRPNPRVQLQRRALMEMTGHSYPGAKNVGTLPTLPSLQQLPIAERTSVGKRNAMTSGINKNAMPGLPSQPRPIFNTLVQSPTMNELPNFGKTLQQRPNALRGLLGAH